MRSQSEADKPLERYVRILEAMSGFPQGLSVARAAEILDLPRTTAHRLMRGLAEVGLVEPAATEAAAFRLGGRLANLLYGATLDDWIAVVSQSLMKDLATHTSQACFIGKLVGDQVLSIAIVAPDNAVRGHVVPGREIMPHTGAAAKAILAFQPRRRVEALLPAPLPALTRHTKTRRAAVLAELDEVRQTGVAQCVNEDLEGFAGLAVPIVVTGHEIRYSLCLAGTVETLINQGRHEHEANLRSVAAKLAKAIETRLPRRQG